MADVPGTGAPGVFSLGPERRDAELAVPLPTEPQALQALEARGQALLLGMLSRIQSIEATLRLERIGRLTAEETVRVTVIDNEEATAEIAALRSELTELNENNVVLTGKVDGFRTAALQYIFDSQQLVFDFQQTVPLPNPILTSWLTSLNILNSEVNSL